MYVFIYLLLQYHLEWVKYICKIKIIPINNIIHEKKKITNK